MTTSNTLNIALLRQGDVEWRELRMFERLASAGAISAQIVGTRTSTPYGTADLRLPVTGLRGIAQTVDRLPFGQTMRSRIEARLGRTMPTQLGLKRVLKDFVGVVSPRETFHDLSRQACVATRGRSDVRVVVSVAENVPFRHEEIPAVCRVKDAVLSAADLFIANSPGAMSALAYEGAPEERIRVVPPGIDTDLFSPGLRSAEVRESWGVGLEDTVILYSGRLIREKGCVELLLSVQRLLAEQPRRGARIVLVMQGQGTETPRLKRAVTALALEEHVRMAPWVATSRMPEVYRSADVVLLPSLPTPYWQEQFGYNLVEAMGCGRAIVSTRSGEIPWVIGDTGLLVEPYDRDQLAAAIRRVVHDVALRERLEANARTRAVSMFGINAAGAGFIDCCREAQDLPRSEGHYE